jgi:chloramphenicol 3-O-phosphotransferase
MEDAALGQIVVLDGAPRAGKSSIVRVIQETFGGPWMNLGVDIARSMMPPRCAAASPGRPADLSTPRERSTETGRSPRPPRLCPVSDGRYGRAIRPRWRAEK